MFNRLMLLRSQNKMRIIDLELCSETNCMETLREDKLYAWYVS